MPKTKTLEESNYPVPTYVLDVDSGLKLEGEKN